MNPVFRERAALAVKLLGRLPRRRIKGEQKKTSPQSSPPSSKPLKSYGILSIAVDPSCQGSGIGKRLMKYSEMIAKEKGFLEINLTVNPRNERAICFYERLGWEKVVNENGWTGHMRKRLE